MNWIAKPQSIRSTHKYTVSISDTSNSQGAESLPSEKLVPNAKYKQV
jgi:hypothetical protein